MHNNNFYHGTQNNVKFSSTEVLSWISHVWSSGRVKKRGKNRSNETLQLTHRNTKGRPVHNPLWWGKWLTYQYVLPILAILLLTRCLVLFQNPAWQVQTDTAVSLWVSRAKYQLHLRSSSWPFCSDSPEWRSAHMCTWFWRHGDAFGSTENALFVLRSQFHLHHRSQRASTEIVSKNHPKPWTCPLRASEVVSTCSTYHTYAYLFQPYADLFCMSCVTECIVCVQGHDPLTFYFLSCFLFFDWVGVLLP